MISNDEQILRENTWVFDEFEQDFILLGKGSFGCVFSCTHRKSKQKMALKLMKTTDLQAFNNLSKEIFTLTRLSHSNIVKIYDFNFNTRIINSNTVQYEIIIAMEQGKETLNEVLKKTPIFSEKELFKIMISLISALAYAHKKKIVHCDIKPANILVFEQANGALDYKISDWGSGFFFQDFNNLKTCAKETMGFTFGYAAPEIRRLEGEDDWDENLINFYQADIYSLGLIFLNCCGVDYRTSKVLSALPQKKYASELLDVINSVKENQSLSIYSIDFYQNIRKMLEYEPEKRFNVQNPADFFADEEQLTVKIVILGCSGVGKSSILKKYMHDEFSHAGIDSTHGANFESKNKKKLKFFFWDTAGHEKFSALNSLVLKDANGVFIVIENPNDTYEIMRMDDICKTVKEICRNEFPPIIVLQNKADNIEISKREDDLLTLRKICRKFNVYEVMQVSAKTGENLNEAFETMMDEILWREKMLLGFQNDMQAKKNTIVLKKNNEINQNFGKKCCYH